MEAPSHGGGVTNTYVLEVGEYLWLLVWKPPEAWSNRGENIQHHHVNVLGKKRVFEVL